MAILVTWHVVPERLASDTVLETCDPAQPCTVTAIENTAMEMIVASEVAGTMRQAGGYRVWVALSEERMRERRHRGLMWLRLMNRRNDTHREDVARAREYYAGLGAAEICGVLLVPVLFSWWRAHGVLWGRANKIVEHVQHQISMVERIGQGARRQMYRWRSKTAEGRGQRYLVAKI